MNVYSGVSASKVLIATATQDWALTSDGSVTTPDGTHMFILTAVNSANLTMLQGNLTIQIAATRAATEKNSYGLGLVTVNLVNDGIVVPEPTTASLSLLALAALMMRRRVARRDMIHL